MRLFIVNADQIRFDVAEAEGEVRIALFNNDEIDT